MNLELTGKILLITGGAGGIGRSMALQFAAEGAVVGICDLNPRAIEEVVSEIDAAGGKSFSAQCDITDLRQVASLAERIEKVHGSVDILVNNAAVLLGHDSFLETSTENCDKEIKVTLYGTMNCCRAMVPGMISRQYGKVINIVTDAARVGQERQCNYSAAKGGVISFTKSFAKEVGRFNVNVNAVSPGATNSPIRQEMLRELTVKIGEEKVAEREEKIRRGYAMRRIGEPEDVARAVLFLASDAARHITGQVLSVNGGYVMV